MPSFDAIAPSLKNRVTRDERTELSKQALQAKLRTEYKFQEDQALKDAIFALADSSLQRGKWKAPFFPNAEKAVLFSLLSKTYTVRGFLSYAQKNQRPNALNPAKYLEQLYNNFTDSNIFQLVEERIIRENPTYSFLLKEYYEGILLFEIMEKEVWNKASEDSVGQHTYYDAHISSYQAGERGKAVLYSSNTGDFSDPLRKIVLEGNEAKVQEFVTAKKLKIESGYYKREDKAIFQKMPLGEGRLFGRKQWNILPCVAKRDTATRSDVV